MSEIKDDFLKDLQAQCLVDSQEYLDSYMEDLPTITQNPSECFKKLAKHIHSLKGNVQAAGFLEFGKFIHDLETELTVIEKGINTKSAVVPETELPILEFLFSDVHHYLTSYTQDLKVNDYNDKIEFYDSRKACIGGLRAWWESLSSPIVKKEIKENTQVNSIKVENIETIPIVEEKNNEVDDSKPVIVPALVADKEEIKPGHYLLCKASERYYGVQVSKIIEIISHLSSVPLPVARPDIKGLINLRGETVSVLSLDNILGNIKKPKYLVICEHDGRSFGFEVEEAERVLVVHQNDLQELPSGHHHFGHKKNISHVVHFEDKQVMILNLTDVIAA